MPNQSSEVVICSSTSNSAAHPTPSAPSISVPMDQNASATRTKIAAKQDLAKQGDNRVTSICEMGQNQLRDTNDIHIPSPPAINNWHLMSTAATTITSNLHPRAFSYQQHQEQQVSTIPMVVPTHHHSQADVVVDDDVPNSNIDTPPVCEIQIPSQQRPKRRADVDDDYGFDDDDDDDADSTSSTQNLSRDDHQHYDAIDYKGMYFTSQRQNYALREQVQSAHEDNRRLKRQLIEMQKQLYTYSRNKRPTHHRTTHRHPNHETGEVAPWSIPMSSTHRLHHHHHHNHHRQPPRVLMVRYPQPPCIIENSNVSPTTPTKATTQNEITTATVATTVAASFLSPLNPEVTAPALTNGVSMSVSSEEGNIIL